MNETQKWYTSKTIWGIIVAFLAFLLQSLGVLEVLPEEQTGLAETLTTLGVSLGELLGLIIALYGRVSATKRIE